MFKRWEMGLNLYFVIRKRKIKKLLCLTTTTTPSFPHCMSHFLGLPQNNGVGVWGGGGGGVRFRTLQISIESSKGMRQEGSQQNNFVIL